MRRFSVYQWLSSAMKKYHEVCHIGMFEIEECNRVVELANAKMEKFIG